MALHLTPQLLEAVYELLRVTPPFKRWKLPHADNVEFRVQTLNNACAVYHYPDKLSDEPTHTITVCASRNRLSLLTEDMAHEMVHLYQRLHLDRVLKRRTGHHGPHFKRLAAQVCRAHGWQLDGF